MPTSAYLQTALLNASLLGTTFVGPSTVYLALYTAGPDSWGVGTEVAGGSYSRQPISFSSPAVVTSTPVTMQTGNSTVANFVSMPACTLSGMAIWDAPVGGNMLHYILFGSPQTVTGGTTFTVGSSQVTINSQ